MLIHEMIIVGDSSPTAHFGGTEWERFPEGYQKDTMAIQTYYRLAQRVVDLLKFVNRDL